MRLMFSLLTALLQMVAVTVGLRLERTCPTATDARMKRLERTRKLKLPLDRMQKSMK